MFDVAFLENPRMNPLHQKWNGKLERESTKSDNRAGRTDHNNKKLSVDVVRRVSFPLVLLALAWLWLQVTNSSVAIGRLRVERNLSEVETSLFERQFRACTVLSTRNLSTLVADAILLSHPTLCRVKIAAHWQFSGLYC